MNHYEVLGISSSASSADVRKAYLDLARRHHPDRAGAGSGTGPTTDGDADGRMREINAAWATLRDPDLRAAYDEELAYRSSAPGRDGSGPTGGSGSVEHQAPRRPRRAENATSPGWQPFDDGDVDEVELLDDTPVEGTEVPRWLQVTPAFLLVGGLIAMCVGLIASIPPMLGLGLAASLLAGMLFVAVPVFAVFTSRSHDPNP